jgi:hypothetical protein
MVNPGVPVRNKPMPIRYGKSRLNPANPFGLPNPNPAAANMGNQPRIIKIEKMYNCIIYEKFINEFKRMLRKYPMKNVHDIMKHLFHGTRTTDPKLIYASEDGLDIRFSNAGAYGNGIYFANNSNYSSGYAFPVPGQ